jgi:hypothetical protein
MRFDSSREIYAKDSIVLRERERERDQGHAQHEKKMSINI